MLLIKKFTFDAAHHLVRYKGKCERLHGHTYHMSVKIEGRPSEDEAMVMDFLDVKKTVKEKVLDRLDHANINDIIEQPTAENIARWVWERLAPEFKRDNCRLAEIEIWETETSGIVYRGDA